MVWIKWSEESEEWYDSVIREQLYLRTSAWIKPPPMSMSRCPPFVLMMALLPIQTLLLTASHRPLGAAYCCIAMLPVENVPPPPGHRYLASLSLLHRWRNRRVSTSRKPIVTFNLVVQSPTCPSLSSVLYPEGSDSDDEPLILRKSKSIDPDGSDSPIIVALKWKRIYKDARQSYYQASRVLLFVYRELSKILLQTFVS